jgi:PKHD-type hydroxylase
MYFLAPSASIEQHYATWENGFSESEIARIVTQGELVSQETGTVENGKVVQNIRKSQIAWLEQNDNTTWVYDKAGYIIRQLNGQSFRLDLTGFGEPFQYTTYRAGGDHYDWHMDKGNNTTIPRKLSMVVQLSSPDEYEGGDLELFTGAEPTKIEKIKGLAVVFPSWIMHRVTPVTAGTRRSLVIWTGGPPIR